MANRKKHAKLLYTRRFKTILSWRIYIHNLCINAYTYKLKLPYDQINDGHSHAEKFQSL